MRITAIEPIYRTGYRANPFRSGFTDAIMGRIADSPWKDNPHATGQNRAYLKGFLAGTQQRKD